MLQRELNLLFIEISLNFDISESEDEMRDKYYQASLITKDLNMYLSAIYQYF